VKIEVDVSGAIRKTAALRKVPQAARKQLARWGANSVRELKRVAAGMKKSGSGRKTGQLARAVGMRMDGRTLIVGTNVRNETDVKYAKIQDEGGTIRPKGHPYLALPLRGIKDRPKDHPNAFVIETRRGNVLLVEEMWRGAGGAGKGWRGSGYKRGIRALFLLVPEVTLRPSRWFTGTMRMMDSLLPGYMDERVILEEAQKLVGTGGSI
jgi:hypothetical protein